MKNIHRKTIFIFLAAVVGVLVVVSLVDLISSNDWVVFKSIRLFFRPIVVAKGTIRSQVIFSGTVDFDKHVTLQFQQVPTNGVMISWVGVKLGDTVKKGQLLASLDQQAVLKQQQLNLSTYWQQRLTFDQTQSDNAGRTPDQSLNDTQKRQLLTSQASLNNSIYNVELQDQVARLSNIWSPIGGVMTRIDTPLAGVNIQSADEARFEVIDPSTLLFSTDIDESEVTNLHVGDKGVLVLNAFPTDYIPATIRNIAFASHQDTNNNTVYNVKLTLDRDNTSYKYKFGMTGNIVFYEYNTNVLYVPNDYIHQDDTGFYVKVGNAKKLVYVQTGISDGKVTEIVKGVNEGDAIFY